MGEIREEVQSFYMRDYVEEKVRINDIGEISHPLVLIMISVTQMVARRWRRGSSSSSASLTWYESLSTMFTKAKNNF